MAQSTTVTKISKSALFTFYNKARSCGIMDRARTNKALGAIQAGRAQLLGDGSAFVRNEDGTTYRANSRGCTCPDWQHRGSKSGQWCKHMICFGILTRMKSAR